MNHCIQCNTALASVKRGYKLFCTRKCGYAHYYKNHRKEIIERTSAQIKWKRANVPGYKEKEYARVREWLSENKQRDATYKRRYRHKKLFGLTSQQTDRMLETQRNTCAICHEIDDRALSLDHDHKTGKVREFLCRICNSALGLVGENIETLSSMIAYVQKHGGEEMPGLTGECLNSQHGACSDRDCRCRCHPWTQAVAPSPSSNPNPASQKLCPTCQRRTPLTENFCRQDGTPLVVGVGCRRCGFPLLGTDKFCACCGVPRTWEPPVETPSAQVEVGKETSVQ